VTKLCPYPPQSRRTGTGLTKRMMKQILLLAMLSSASLAQQDADTIIRRSVAANEADWKAAHEYDYVERDRQKGGATKTSEEIMILGSPYERLAAVNGKPLPPEQQEREQQELETTLVERRKESGPTVQGRTSDEDLRALYIGRGYKPYFVEGDDPEVVHQLLAGTLDDCYAEIRAIQREARQSGFKKQPIWPMIVLRTPKGWTCPKQVDGIPIEGTFRAHQVPLATVRENPEHLKILEAWMRSYKPEELFDQKGRFIAELAELAPVGDRRMGGNPHVNGGRR
jgi:hypothetical protein